jgi:hypothetical protein
MTIWLGEEVLARAIGRSIVDKEEAVHTQLSMVLEKIGQTDSFVLHRDNGMYFPRANLNLPRVDAYKWIIDCYARGHLQPDRHGLAC